MCRLFDRVFIGIDLGISLKRKSTGIAYLVEKNRKPWVEAPPEHVISEDTLLYSIITRISENFSFVVIAIDAPLSRPEYGNLRECEKQLRRYGVACYPSGAEWVSKWVDKAIRLKDWAEKQLGAEVIEVYPYAARLNIGVKKKTRYGRGIIQNALNTWICGLRAITKGKILSDDELDAVLSAYIAYLETKGNALRIKGKDGAITIPQGFLF